MNPKRWQKIEEIVQSALDIEAGAERIRFVSETCAGDDDLRHEVERLLAADDAANSFIESPAWAVNENLLHSVVEKKRLSIIGRAF